MLPPLGRPLAAGEGSGRSVADITVRSLGRAATSKSIPEADVLADGMAAGEQPPPGVEPGSLYYPGPPGTVAAADARGGEASGGGSFSNGTQPETGSILGGGGLHRVASSNRLTGVQLQRMDSGLLVVRQALGDKSMRGDRSGRGHSFVSGGSQSVHGGRVNSASSGGGEALPPRSKSVHGGGEFAQRA